MRFPPEAFIIGAQKSGTTSLAYVLSLHPEVTLSDPKEPDFFTRYWPRGEQWYRGLFKGPDDALLVDGSTSYTMAPLKGGPATGGDVPLVGVPGRIHAVSPKAKFIYVLRDPVTRTYSHYWHTVRTGEQRLPFREAIEQNDLYLRIGDYHAQLRTYLEFFPLEAFLITGFEDMIQDLQGTAQRCFEFLGVPPRPVALDDHGSRKNTSFAYRGPALALSRLISQRGWRALVAGGRAVVPKRLKPLVARAVTGRIPPLADADRDFLVEYFREPTRKLEQFLGVRFSRWHQ